MKQELTVNGAASTRDFDLGTWLGRRQAFSMMSGKTSAADVECLRTIRDQRLYKARSERWGDFCAEHIGASKTQVDRLIRQLEEFGPQFFELTNVTRISPETYRLIAPHVSEQGVRLDGETIPIAQEHGARVSAAVAALRRRVEPAPKPRLPKAGKLPHEFIYAVVSVDLETLIDNFKEVESLTADERREIGSLLLGLQSQTIRLDVDW